MSELAPTVPLLHGAAMPRLGLGTWPRTTPRSSGPSSTAIGLGYRSVDTAENYRNERGVGQRPACLGAPSRRALRHDEAQQAVARTRPRRRRRWTAASSGSGSTTSTCCSSTGRTPVRTATSRRGRGWSDCSRPGASGRSARPTSSRPISNGSSPPPAWLPTSTRSSSARCTPATLPCVRLPSTGSSPSRGRRWAEVGRDVLRISRWSRRWRRGTGRTPAQVVLRWHMELGLVTVPKSSDPDRLRQNLEIFDFALSAEDVAALSALDRGESAAADSDRFGH